jgi:2-methylisocitrate lyase-like PEP mutase family enzyme
VIPLEDAARKIKVAAKARSSKDFKIIARTDARTAHGLDEALRRGDAFLKAGADIVFIESPESAEEMERIGRTFNAPLLANMVEGGRTPILNSSELEKLGYKIAIYPVAGLLAATSSIQSIYAHLKATGSTQNWDGHLYPFSEFVRMIGFERVWGFEQANAEDE